MTLVKWDPFQRMSSLQDRINRLFDNSIAHSGEMNEEISTCAWRPAVDIYETQEGVVLKAELPGITKKNVSIELKDNILMIKGVRPSETTDKEDNYYRRERCFGSFHRSFTLRDTVDPEKIKAKFKDGILEIEIPRSEEEKPKQIEVETI